MPLSNLAADLWNWVAGVFTRIGDISVLPARSRSRPEDRGVGVHRPRWRNLLLAAYPDARLSFKTGWGAAQGGTAINAVTPAQAGTAAMIGIFRATIPGSSAPGLASATVVQSLFFTAVSVLMLIGVAIFRPRRVSKGSP